MSRDRASSRFRGRLSDGAAAPFDPSSRSSVLFWVDAADENNVTEIVSEDFDPSDVDTATDKITLATTGFVRGNPCNFNTVRFTTTGTLPGGLELDTDYIAENNGDGTYSFWPVASDADYTQLPGYAEGETVFEGDLYGLQKGKIDLTSQGSGTHTMTTNTLIQSLYDKISASALWSVTERANRYEMLSDGNGPYIAMKGSTALSNDFIEPNGKFMPDTLSASELGDMFDGKRYAYAVMVMRPKYSGWLSKARAICKPANVNSGTGVFTSTNHGMTTGEEVTLDVLSDGGAFPTPTVSFADPVYVRAVSANTVTIHPTSADASANTNKYVFSDTGSGIFSVTGTVNAKTASSFRRLIIDLSMQSNDHSFSPQLGDRKAIVNLGSSSYFLGGSSDGLIDTVATTASMGDRSDLIYLLNLLIPDGATGPICDDTGMPLTSGSYYATRQPSNTNRIRLHRTYEDAENSLGVAVASLTNDDVIKYGTLGNGDGSFFFSENVFNWRNFDDAFDSTNIDGYATYEEFAVYVQKVDFDDGVTGKRLFYSGINAINNLIDGLPSAKNSPIPSQSANTALLLGNAAEPHVPGSADLYEIIIGASDDDPDADIQYLINGLMSEYSIS